MRKNSAPRATRAQKFKAANMIRSESGRSQRRGQGMAYFRWVLGCAGGVLTLVVGFHPVGVLGFILTCLSGIPARSKR